MSIPPFLDSPRGVGKRMVAIGGVTLATLDNHAALAADTKASGVSGAERVLFVPGFTGSKEDFIALLEPLAAAGVAAVACDQRGQFESAASADPAQFTLAQHADDLRKLALAVWPDGPRPHLVGHSFGGLVARMAVLRDPTSFASLTLLSSGPSKLPEHQHPDLVALQSAIPHLDLGAIWELKEAMAAARGDQARPAPALKEFLHRRWLANNLHALMGAAEILLHEPDRVDQLRACGVPTAVMFGTLDDVWWPDTQRDMARRLHARLCAQVWGVGHSPAAEAPRITTAALLEFWHSLRELPSSSAPETGVAAATRAELPRSRLVAESDGYTPDMALFFDGTTDLRTVRHAVLAQTTQWGCGAASDDAALVVSELVTNAQQHSVGMAWVGVCAHERRIHIAVSDHSQLPPRRLAPEPFDHRGRGLQVVSVLSSAWGVTPEPHGKTVWADLDVDETATLADAQPFASQPDPTAV